MDFENPASQPSNHHSNTSHIPFTTHSNHQNLSEISPQPNQLWNSWHILFSKFQNTNMWSSTSSLPNPIKTSPIHHPWPFQIIKTWFNHLSYQIIFSKIHPFMIFMPFQKIVIHVWFFCVQLVLKALLECVWTFTIAWIISSFQIIIPMFMFKCQNSKSLLCEYVWCHFVINWFNVF